VEVTAANGSVINILGHMAIKFAIEGVDLKADLLVTDEVDEFMLGFDWLTAQKARWDFNAKTLCGILTQRHFNAKTPCTG